MLTLREVASRAQCADHFVLQLWPQLLASLERLQLGCSAYHTLAAPGSASLRADLALLIERFCSCGSCQGGGGCRRKCYCARCRMRWTRC